MSVSKVAGDKANWGTAAIRADGTLVGPKTYINAAEAIAAIKADDAWNATDWDDSATAAEAVTAVKADAAWNATEWDTAHGWGDHGSAGYKKPDIVSVVAADGTAGTGTVTITVTDADASPIDFYFEGWVSDAANGGVVSQTAALSVTTGIQLQEIVAGDHYRGISASGSVVLTLTGDDTGHVVLVIQGKVYTTPYTVTTA